MSRQKRIVLVGGTQPDSFTFRKRKELYEDPDLRPLLDRAQSNLSHMRFSGSAVDLKAYCTQEDLASTSPGYCSAMGQIFTAVTFFHQWTSLRQQLLENQRTRKRKLTRIALLGHSYGLWLAAILAGLCDDDFDRALHDIIAPRAKHTCEVLGPSILIRQRGDDKPDIDTHFVAQLCKHSQGAWVSVVNHSKQIVVSGTEAGVDKVQQTLNVLLEYDVSPVNIFVPWHTPLLRKAAHEIEKKLPSVQQLSKLRIPVCYLDSKGRLKQTKDVQHILQLMLRELQDPWDYAAMVRQLPTDAQWHEIAIRPYQRAIVDTLHQPDQTSSRKRYPKPLLAHPQYA